MKMIDVAGAGSRAFEIFQPRSTNDHAEDVRRLSVDGPTGCSEITEITDALGRGSCSARRASGSPTGSAEGHRGGAGDPPAAATITILDVEVAR